MNEKIYYSNPYLKEIKCSVVSFEKTESYLEVITDKTIFYPECGGQPGDIGYLGFEKVLGTRKADNGDSVLLLDPSAEVLVGKTYELKLDWSHRYKYMVMHACQHMTSGLLFYLFNIGTVSVHLGDDYIAIETDQSEIKSSVIDELVDKVNEKISEDHKIIYHEMSHKEAEALGLRRSIKVEGDVRIVEIEDVDRIACGGVHVSSTSEIGLFVYTGQEQIRGHVRLFFACGESCRKRAWKNEKILNNLNSLFSCSYEDFPKNTEVLLSDLSETKTKNLVLSKKLAKCIIEKNINNNIAVFEDTDGLDLQAYASCVPDFDNLALCTVSVSNDKTLWLVSLKGEFERLEFSVIKEKLFPLIEAKGGGRLPVFQGMGLRKDRESIGKFLEEFKNLL